MSWLLDGRPLRRILVTRLRYLGDIAMSTVVLAALRRGDPDVQLGYLCEAGHAALLAGHPDLARVHALRVRRTGKDAATRRAVTGPAAQDSASAGTLVTIGQLRRARYDLAVDLLFNPRSAWLLRLADIPARIGGLRRGHRRRLYTHLAPSPAVADRPALYRRAGGGLGEHLSRLAPLRHADGRPFLDWLEQEIGPDQLAPRIIRPQLPPAVGESFARWGVEPSRCIMLAPTATWPAKAWPAPYWRELAAGLRAAGHAVVVLSTPGTQALAADLAAAIGSGPGGVLPPLPLVSALAAVAAARVLVSVDGGLVHAAVAMGVPTVALFGPTDPSLWFPYERLGPYRVLATRPACHPCDRHRCDAFICLPDLASARVQRAVQALLDGGVA